MKLIVCSNYEELSRKAVELIADSIRENPSALVSFPGGNTSLGMLHLFADMVNRGELDISKARFVQLDDWVGLSSEDKGAGSFFMRKELLERLHKPFSDVHLIDSAAEDIERERAALDDYIARYGPLELSVLGIGLNGHVGFNEPGVDFDLNAHIIRLSETSKKAKSKVFGDKFLNLEYGITQGITQIMKSKKVVLIANGAHKANIIRMAVEGEITNQVPASVLQNHPNGYVVIDKAAAALL